MLKPTFVFDGLNIPDAEKLKEIGFEYKSIGKSDNKYFTIIVDSCVSDKLPYWGVIHIFITFEKK